MKQEVLIKSGLISEYRKYALENEWDDIIYLNDREIQQIINTSENDVIIEKKSSIIEELEILIEKIEKEINEEKLLLNDKTLHYLDRMEITDDINLLERKLFWYLMEYNRLKDEKSRSL